MAIHHDIQEAFEVYGYQTPSRYLFSCEHASNRIPHPLVSTLSDQRDILHTHWAWDIGTKLLVQELVRMTKSTAIFARFSRLVVDPNRHPNRHDLIVPNVEGRDVSFNQSLDEVDVAWRLDSYYNPYHDGFTNMVSQRLKSPEPFLLISVHSFTPVWKGRVRTMDVGVLFDKYEETAIQLKEQFEHQGFFTELNQPYSGKFGLMYSVAQQGENFQIPHLELEFNQAQICTPERVKHVAQKVFQALEQIYIPN